MCSTGVSPAPAASIRSAKKRSLWVVLATALFVLLQSFGAAIAQPADDPSQVNLEENDYSFIVNVRNENQPVPDARLVVTGEGYEAEAITNEDGRARIGVPTMDDYEVFLDEESLPEGVGVDPEEGGTNPVTVRWGSQSFAPANFYLGDDVRQVTGFFDQFVERLINGLNFGLMLALAAIGLSLIFGTTGLTNFAHADMVTFGPFAALILVGGGGYMSGLPLWAALPLALVASAIFGLLIDAGLWRPLRRRGLGLVQLMILTIGFSLAMRYIFQFFIGGTTYHLPGAGGARHQIIGPIRLSTVDMISMGISITVLLFVAYWLLKTRLGKATRAVSDNQALAAASGINVEAVTRFVWVSGAALAGLSGILWAYFRPGLRWDMGVQLLLLIFAAVVLGGLGTAFGALVGSLIIGILVETSTLWIPGDIKYVGALGVLVVILLVRPQGILGRRARIG